ncbi:hypothetical protein [Chryseobacterium sp. HSC-36S06]|uniref:hypothetical protein n=1 Tax=Chryseobacterium sp. HSC-36S06 TaxID=2910970 RepID=UPI0020A07B31|nr:hypothetical protein [Chryseobacterium sp. HSC-36S06]MCP2037335.1 hypothetical protein [Chryseobacterium sp. HSC-36S06]
MAKKSKQTLALFIPKNLNLDELINTYPPQFNFHKDDFVYILHLISDIPSKNKDKEYDYVPLSSAMLQRRVRNYRKGLDYFVSHGILEENSSYQSNNKSKSFRFTSEYDTELQVVDITKAVLIKNNLCFKKVTTGSIPENNNLRKLIYSEKKPSFKALLGWFEGLDVDMEQAEKILNNLKEQEKDKVPTAKAEYEKNKNEKKNKEKYYKLLRFQNRFNMRWIPLKKIPQAQYWVSVDRTAGRLHSPLTGLKKELRNTLSYKGKKLVSIDISNSQPYLATVFFEKEVFNRNNMGVRLKQYDAQLNYNMSPVAKGENRQDLKMYIDAVSSGQFYERFQQELEKLNLIPDDIDNRRDYVKRIMFAAFFSPNYHSNFVKEIKVFQKAFPSVAAIFSFIKKKQHRVLACTLQNLEADIILNDICGYLTENHPEVPLFTIHDSIATTEDYTDLAYEIMQKILTERIGVPPTLSVEHWK